MGKKEAILALVARGKTTREISGELGIAISTVRYYREPGKSRRGLQITEHRRRVKRKAIDYSGGRCLKCNYDKCHAALVFHHLDPSIKEHGLSSGCSWGWDKTKVELDKTLLVCGNCHAECHAGLWEPDEAMIKKQQQIRDAYADKPLAHYATILR